VTERLGPERTGPECTEPEHAVPQRRDPERYVLSNFDIPRPVRERLTSVRGFVFDLDGTLVLGDRNGRGLIPLPGALEITRWAARQGLPFVVFTNGTTKTPRELAQALRGTQKLRLATLRPSALQFVAANPIPPSIDGKLWTRQISGETPARLASIKANPAPIPAGL